MIDSVKRTLHSRVLQRTLLVVLADVILYWHLTALWLIPLAVFILISGKIFFQLIVRQNISIINRELYSTGLGLFVLLATGTLLNEIGRVVGVKAPLSVHLILVVVHIELLLALLSSLVIHQRKPRPMNPAEIEKKYVLPHFRPLDIATIVLTGIVVLAIIGGVNVLNNGGTNWLAMTALIGAACLPILVVLMRKKLSVWSYIVTLFGISTALLLLTSLRSHYLVGSDVLNEYGIAHLVSRQGFWSITQLNNTYNACLSITVLPQVLHAISGQDGLVIFRDVVQVIFSIAPIILFSIARNYFKPTLAYLSGISFLVFINYNGSLPNHIRQEIGLLFFMLMIMAILSREIPRYAQKIFVVLFSLVMVVSHYSTAYVAIIIFVVSSVINIIVTFRQSHGALDNPNTHQMGSVINFRMTIAIIMFTFFWYSQIVQSSGGPAAYLSSLGKQFFGSSYTNQQADQTSLKDQFNINHKSKSSQNVFAEYLKTNKIETPTYHPKVITPQVTQPKLKPKALNSLLNLGAQLAKKVYKFLAIGGMIILLWQACRRKSKYDIVFIELLAGCMGVIVISFLIPSFTVDYDQERMFQQLLVILAIPLVYFAQLLMSRFPKNTIYAIVALFLGFYLLISTSFLGQIAGGLPTPLQLNNSGTDYARYYVHSSEVDSALWIQSIHRYQPIYADGYASNRLNFATSGSLKIENGLVPGKFLPGAFIYYDYGNISQNTTYASFNNGPLLYTAPTDYLNDNTNLIYSNGGSVVYAKPY